MSKSAVHFASALTELMSIGLVLLVIACTGSASAQDNPLVEAVRKGDQLELERLLKNGADVNSRDHNRNTPLASAALLGDIEAVRMLLDHGADVNAPGSFGAAPLILASMTGSPEIVRMLLNKGAAVNIRGPNGATPLITAAMVNSPEVVKMLLDEGADASTRDLLGKTASTYAAENGNTEVSELLMQHERSLNTRVRNFFRSFYPFTDPVAFRIGRLGVRWYGLMYLVGFIVAAVIGRAELLRRGEPAPSETAARMLLYGLIGVIVGGRLGAILIYYPSYFFAHPWQIFALWRGGMSFHGGLIGVFVAGLILARRGSLAFAEMADITALAFPIGNMLVKIGNFINGEIVGTVTTVPWGIVFPRYGNLPRHPSQLYEAFLEGLVIFVILWRFRLRAQRPGEVFALFLVLYGVFRFAVEFFREPDASILGDLQWVTIGQIFSILMIMAGVGLLIFLRRAKGLIKSCTYYPQKETPP
jgi:phosphatidylglycerol:prolipoprotein diacylglycerol transferase